MPPEDPSFPSATPLLPAAHWYEREVRDLLGLTPIGHPDPRRLVLHDDWPRGYHPLRKDVDGRSAPPRAEPRPFPYRHVHGEGITEVPVGPIHAGIIEPGHFRFGVIGERVVHLEARLFYVHRGIEKICEGLPVDRALEIVERICGVCTLAHSVAYCQAVEAIAGVEAPPRARALRTALLELERLYNHVGEVGNICAGVGLAAGTMAGARLKDQLQRLAERLTGSRYLRGMARPGGLGLDPDQAALDDFARTVDRVAREFRLLETLLLGTDSLCAGWTPRACCRCRRRSIWGRWAWPPAPPGSRGISAWRSHTPTIASSRRSWSRRAAGTCAPASWCACVKGTMRHG